MSDPPRQDGNGWTFQTFKHYVDERFSASEQAIEKADTQLDYRFKAVNEFRGILTDLSNSMLLKAEYNAQHKALLDRLDLNTRRIELVQLQLAELTAREAGKNQGFGVVASVIMGLVTGLSSLVALAVLVIYHGK